MIKGLATLVEYTNGKMDIENWSGATTPPSTVLMARQNLHLLVVHSRIDPDVTALNVETGWGFTLHGDPAVWRTGVGVDRFGNLIYIAAPSQTPETFAALFLRLNCVRAMQLDINPEWPIFITYAAKDAGGPSLGFPNSNQVADRFLYPSTKDFFAVYEREKTQPQPPW
jgi:hypothetical protein